jgi:hypothetical protein
MALQGSSTISFADINTELGRGSTTQIGINEAEGGTYGAINQASAQKPNGSTPNAIDEWYSYNHSAAFNQFMVAVATSATGGSTCGLSIIRTVRTSDNATSIVNASNGVTVYRMPQNTILTTYRRIADVSFDGINYNPESSEYDISTGGILGNDTNIFC